MDEPPPLPRSLPLAAIVGPREDLPLIYRDLIERLARETIPENTRRALESDLRYLAAWRRVATGEELAFPESEDVVARFILDHSADLEAMAPDDAPRLTADVLIDLGLRRSRAMPRPSTLERRLASWRRLHGARNLAGPFGSPALRSRDCSGSWLQAVCGAALKRFSVMSRMAAEAVCPARRAVLVTDL